MSAPAAAHAKSASTIRLHLARPQRGEAGRGFAVASGLLEQIRLFLKGLGAPPHGLSAAGPLPPNDTSRTSLSANRARSFSIAGKGPQVGGGCAIVGRWMVLPTYPALRIVRRLPRGSSSPVHVVTPAGDFVVKLRGAAQGLLPL